MSELFNQTISDAQKGKFIPAPERLALFVCRSLGGGKENDMDDMATKGIGLFGAALVDMGNDNTKNATFEEVGYLFEMFVELFTEKRKELKEKNQRDLRVRGYYIRTAENENEISDEFDKIRKLENEISVFWSVDYGPTGDFNKILVAWKDKINNMRKANGENPLPKTMGVGFKCNYISDRGCARFDNTVIQMDGNLTKENPWETFYKTGIKADKEFAEKLQPEMPAEWASKFMNRDIISKIGYTVSDAIVLANNQNWGVVEHLFTENKIPINIGFKVLEIAARAKYWNIFMLMYKKQFPIVNPFAKHFYYSEFYNLFKGADIYTLNSILKSTLNIPKFNPINKKEFLKELVRTTSDFGARGKRDSIKIIKWLQNIYIAVSCSTDLQNLEMVEDQEYMELAIDFNKQVIEKMENNSDEMKPQASKTVKTLSKYIKVYEEQNQQLHNMVKTNMKFFTNLFDNNMSSTILINRGNEKCVVCTRNYGKRIAFGEKYDQKMVICEDKCYNRLKQIFDTNLTAIINDKGKE